MAKEYAVFSLWILRTGSNQLQKIVLVKLNSKVDVCQLHFLSNFDYFGVSRVFAEWLLFSHPHQPLVYKGYVAQGFMGNTNKTWRNSLEQLQAVELDYRCLSEQELETRASNSISSKQLCLRGHISFRSISTIAIAVKIQV